MSREAPEVDPPDATPGVREASAVLVRVQDVLSERRVNFEVALEAVFSGDDCTDEQVSETIGAVMEALVDLGVIDPSIGGSLATRKFEIALVVEAETEEEAFASGTRLIAQALRQVGLSLETQTTGATEQSLNAQTDDAPTLEWFSTSVRPAAVA